jgi:hypothetical protein
MKVVKMVFWPYHCEEEEETSTLVKTTQKSDVGHDRTRLQGIYPCAQTHPTCLLRQDGLTQPEYQTTRPICMTRIRMTSVWCNCYISMPDWHVMPATSQLTRQHSGSHMPRHRPRTELGLSWGIGSSVVDPTCNRMWDWIWAVDYARIVLIKS